MLVTNVKWQRGRCLGVMIENAGKKKVEKEVGKKKGKKKIGSQCYQQREKNWLAFIC